MTNLVYICGPITAPTAWQQEHNIRAAEHVFALLAVAGIPAICPHLHSRFLDGLVTHEEWMALDFAILDRCTDLVCVTGWEQSKGSLQEREHARRRGIRVWDSLGAFLAAREVAA